MTLKHPAVLAGILVVAAFSEVRAAKAVERDVAYGKDPLQRLDLFLPATEIVKFPVVVFVHGGSLTSGDKADSDYGAVCTPFVAAGIACANVNYRLGPAHAWPAQAEDVAASFAWVKAHIGERGGDPSRLFLVGHSSGAMLVAVLGSDETFLKGQGLKSSDVRGVVPMGSIMWDDELEQAVAKHGRARVEASMRKNPHYAMWASPEAYRNHWPIRHVRAGMPPYLFLIAEAEQTNPPVLKTNQAFVEKAVALGNRAEYRVLPGRNHYGAIRRIGERDDPVFAILRDFVLERHVETP